MAKKPIEKKSSEFKKITDEEKRKIMEGDGIVVDVAAMLEIALERERIKRRKKMLPKS